VPHTYAAPAAAQNRRREPKGRVTMAGRELHLEGSEPGYRRGLAGLNAALRFRGPGPSHGLYPSPLKLGRRLESKPAAPDGLRGRRFRRVLAAWPAMRSAYELGA